MFVLDLSYKDVQWNYEVEFCKLRISERFEIRSFHKFCCSSCQNEFISGKGFEEKSQGHVHNIYCMSCLKALFNKEYKTKYK